MSFIPFRLSSMVSVFFFSRSTSDPANNPARRQDSTISMSATEVLNSQVEMLPTDVAFRIKALASDAGFSVCIQEYLKGDKVDDFSQQYIETIKAYKVRLDDILGGLSSTSRNRFFDEYLSLADLDGFSKQLITAALCKSKAAISKQGRQQVVALLLDKEKKPSVLNSAVDMKGAFNCIHGLDDIANIVNGIDASQLDAVEQLQALRNELLLLELYRPSDREIMRIYKYSVFFDGKLKSIELAQQLQRQLSKKVASLMTDPETLEDIAQAVETLHAVVDAVEAFTEQGRYSECVRDIDIGSQKDVFISKACYLLKAVGDIAISQFTDKPEKACELIEQCLFPLGQLLSLLSSEPGENAESLVGLQVKIKESQSLITLFESLRVPVLYLEGGRLVPDIQELLYVDDIEVDEYIEEDDEPSGVACRFVEVSVKKHNFGMVLC